MQVPAEAAERLPASSSPSPAGRLRAAGTSLRRMARGELLLLTVLLLAAVLRVVTFVAYRPALMWSDSWSYVQIALSRFPTATNVSRPSGYPLLVRLFTLNGHSLATLVLFQHLAALLVGVAVYALLRRGGVPRLGATAAAAVPLFEGYTLALSEYVMPETFFALAVLASFLLVCGRVPGRGAVAASGALLAVAVSIRTVAVFALPVWAVYLLLRRFPPRRVVAGVGTLVAVLLLYCAAHVLAGGAFSLAGSDGWFLYGRVMRIADCPHLRLTDMERMVCQHAPPAVAENPDWYIWDPSSPADRAFHSTTGGPVAGPGNAVLRSLAVKVIEDRPVAYARMLRDVVQSFFSSDGSDMDDTVRLPRVHEYQPNPPEQRVRARYFPSWQGRTHFPAGAVARYQQLSRFPRPLLGWISALVLAALAAGVVGRRWLAHRHGAVVFLLMGSAAAMVVGAAATAAASLRYVVPMIPLAVAATALTLHGLRVRTRRPATR